MKTIVYLGPSLPIDAAKDILPDAIFKGPARQSDILSDAVNDRPDIIVLIDGLFHQNLSTWHKEILYALSQGIHVIGGGSMGALRAVECEEFGMVGVGRVFDWYKEQVVMPYDEVSVSHDEAGKILSLPMIEVRFTLDRMQMEGEIDSEEAGSIIKAFKDTYFPQRTINLIPESLRGAFWTNYDQAKTKDAADCLSRAAEIRDSNERFNPSFEMVRSHLFEAQFERDRRVRLPDGNEIPLSEVDAWAAFNDPDFHRDNWNAANRECAVILASVLGIKPTEDDEKDERDRWPLSEHDPESKQIEYENAAIRCLHRAVRASMSLRRNTGCYMKHSKMMGKALSLAEEASVFRRLLNKLFPDFMQTASGEVTEEEIMKHVSPLDPHQFMEETGIISEQELKIEIEKRKMVYGAS